MSDQGTGFTADDLAAIRYRNRVPSSANWISPIAVDPELEALLDHIDDLSKQLINERALRASIGRTVESLRSELEAAFLTIRELKRERDYIYENRQKIWGANTTLRAALEAIHAEGRVCDDYETCQHKACASSHRSWSIADAALAELDAITWGTTVKDWSN